MKTQKAPRIEIYQAKHGQFFWLIARGSEPVLVSEMYTRRASVKRAIVRTLNAISSTKKINIIDCTGPDKKR